VIHWMTCSSDGMTVVMRLASSALYGVLHDGKLCYCT